MRFSLLEDNTNILTSKYQLYLPSENDLLAEIKEIIDSECKNESNAKPCLKSSTIVGMLTAYRLFYVGCSRAKKELTVFVDKMKIVGYENEIELI